MEEQLPSSVAENDIVEEWFGVTVRGSSITEQKKDSKAKTEKIKAGADDQASKTT